MKCLFLFLACLCGGASIGYSALKLDFKEQYQIEILWDPNTYLVDKSLKDFELAPNRVTLSKIMVPNARLESLVQALEKCHPAKGAFSRDPEWAIFIKDWKGKALVSCYADGWALDGIVDGASVSFDKELGDWIRANLTQVFELKRSRVWSPEGMR